MSVILQGYGRIFGVFMALILFSAISIPVLAAEKEAVNSEFSPVTTEKLKDMLDSKIPFTLIDARSKEEFEEAHIGSAVHVTEKDFDASLSKLPANKSSLLVMYCNGIKCGKSVKVALKAKAAGYSQILIYRDGFPVWEEKGMPIVAGPNYEKKIKTTKLAPKDLQKVLQEKKDEYVVVDVRDEFEFSEGHIEGAINLPVETFASGSGVLPKEKSIVVYCNSGGRSYNAYRKLMKLGYSKIYQSIFAEWKEAGLPMVKSALK